MSRSGKIALWVAGGLAVALVVFLIAIAVGQGLGQAALWATVLGLPIGLIGAFAGVLALVIKPGTSQPRPDPELEQDQNSGQQVTPVRLATVGVRGLSLDVFGLLPDGTVQHWWWPRDDGGQDWSGPEVFRALPGDAGPVADIAADSRGPGHEEVLAVDQRGGLWHRTWLQGEGWSDWQRLSSPVANLVATANLKDGEVEAFVADQQRSAIRHTGKLDSASSHDWADLDVPDAEPQTSGITRLAAVGVRGQYLDAWALHASGKLAHWWWPRSDQVQTWSEPEDFAAPAGTVDIAAISRGPGHAEVFAVDRHGNLWHRWWLKGEGWVIWQKFTSNVGAPVSACSFGEGHIQIFVVDMATKMIKYSSSSAPAVWDQWMDLR